MVVDNCYWLNYNALFWSTQFFVLPNSLIVSVDNNSNL